VTAEGVVKLVDFGIARQLESGESSLTRAGERALTPDYASPEQMQGKMVTPASDVYSLGVVLYQLLTGKLPFQLRGATPAQMERMVLESEPALPSAVAERANAGSLRGDLDNIVAKAMCKDPAMRYESVEALSADLERYQKGFPVLAAPLSAGYRARKFIARNRWGVATAAAFLIALAVFVGFVIRERNLANRERIKAEQVAKFLTDSFQAASAEQARGQVVTARDIVDRGALRIGSELKNEPDVQATLMRTLGVVYSSIGEHKKGLALVEKAVETRSRAGANVQPSELVQDAVAAGSIRFETGKGGAGIKQLQEAVKLQEQVAPGDVTLRGNVLTALGQAYARSGKFSDAERTLQQAIEVRKREGDEVKLAESYGHLARSYVFKGKYAEALPVMQSSFDILNRVYGQYHPAVIEAYFGLLTAYQETGRYEEAIKAGEQAVAGARKIYGKTAAYFKYAAALGNAYTRAGRLEDSLRLHMDTLSVVRNSENALPGSIVAALNSVSIANRNLGRHEEGRLYLEEALKLARSRGPVSDVLQNNWAVSLRQNGELEQALVEGKASLASLMKKYSPEHISVSSVRKNVALMFMDLGRYSEAEPLLLEAQKTDAKTLPQGNWLRHWTDLMLAECKLAKRQPKEAEAMAKSAAEALLKAKQPTASAALLVQGQALLAFKQYGEAEKVLRRALEIEAKPSIFHDAFTKAVTEASLAHALRGLKRNAEAEAMKASAAKLLAKFPKHVRLRNAIAGTFL
jgi:eukaryotic-like serine/threonine-protein kinase